MKIVRSLLIFSLFIFLKIPIIIAQNINPSLIYPTTGYIVSDPNINFKWNNIKDYDSAQFILSDNINFSNIIFDTTFSNNNEILIHLNSHGKLFWKIINIKNSESYFSTTGTFILFSPTDINNILLWLTPDTGIYCNDSLIYKWNNIIDTSLAFIQSNSSNQPYLTFSQLLNSRKIVHFSGNQFLSGGDVLDLLTSSHTFFFVGKTNNSSGYFFAKKATSLGSYYAFGYYANHIYFEYFDEINKTIQTLSYSRDFQIVSAVNDRINLFNSMYINSILKTSTSNIRDTNFVFDSPTRFLIGAHSSADDSGEAFKLNGDIAEIIIYSQALNDSLRTLVEQYLRFKYAPPVSLGYNIYKQDFCPTTLDAGGRFTSYLWSTGDTTQTIQVNHTGTYSVTVTDIFGFQSSDSVFVQYPEPNIPFGDTVLCYGDTLIWDLQLDSTLYSFSWSNGDTTQFIRIFNPGGNYFCTITDTAGCQMITDTITVSIDSFPIQSLFIPHDTSICAGTNLYPTDQQIYNTIWNTGDTTVYITVQDSGTYTLSADNINGCHTTDTINVSIHGVAPLIDFSWANHCFGDTTFFNNNSQLQDTSTFTTFIWRIDTLQNDTAFQTSVLFPDTLTYQVTLEGYTSSNCYNITSKQIKIYPTPQVSFTQPHICQHTLATITPQINSAYQIENYLWQLDNTETATTQNFTHTFDSVATHNISISITDENGCSGEFSSTVEVLSSPVANFYTTNQCQNTTIIFHDSTLSEFYNPVVSSMWNIDNNNLEGMAVSYTFDSSGYFPITHFVTAVNGCKDTIAKNIRIYPTPDIQIPDTIYLCANTKETLSVQIPDSVLPVNYSWTIDSTAYSNECCLKLLFTDTGFHNLEVTTTTTHSCTETKESVINVLPQPSADFDVYLASHKVTSNYLLDDAVYHVIAKDTSYPHYFWSSYFFSFTEFEDYEFGYDMAFQTIYGDGIIVLRVVDQNGCQDTSYFSYHVYSPFDEMDLKISNVSYTKQNDFIFPIVTIKNQGNSPAKPYITCELKGSGKIMEQIDKVIYPGNSYTYSFRSGIEQNSEPLVLCAYIVYPWLDNYYHNSERCITDNSETIRIMNIYPQPANNQLNIDLIFNIGNGDIYFYFLNSLGQKTAYFSKTVSKGYNHLTFDISSLPAGEYFLKIIAGSQTITKRFIKK